MISFMNSFKYLIILLLLTVSFALLSCNNSEQNSDKNEDTIQIIDKVNEDSETENLDENIIIAKYICPNRCEEGKSDKPGECSNPECGMELEENLDYKSN